MKAGPNKRKVKGAEDVFHRLNTRMKKIVHPGAMPYISLALVVFIFLSAFLLQDAVLTGMVLGPAAAEYSDEIGINFSGAQEEYVWYPENFGKINSISLDGVIVGNGSVTVKLVAGNSTYTVLDSSLLELESSGAITGMVTGGAESEDVTIGDMTLDQISMIKDKIGKKDKGDNNGKGKGNDKKKKDKGKKKGDGEDVPQNIPPEDAEISIELDYGDDSEFDSNNDGIETYDGVVDLAVDAGFSWDADESKLCTKWTIENDESVRSVCHGSARCCDFIEAERAKSSWNQSYYSYKGLDGAEENNTITAQVVYVDYNLSSENLYSHIYFSDTESKDARFVPGSGRMIEFEDSCIDTCLMLGMNHTSYRLIIETDPGVMLELHNIRYRTEDEAEETGNVTVDLSIEDAEGNEIAADIEVFDQSRHKKLVEHRTDMLDKDMKGMLTPEQKKKNNISLRSGMKDIKIKPAGHTIESIDVEDAEIGRDVADFIKIDDITSGSGSSRVKKLFAIDPTGMNFSNATVTTTAGNNSRYLFKCPTWNFTAQECPVYRTCSGDTKDTRRCNVTGGWHKIKKLNPGERYNFTLTSTDPGYAEYSSDFTAPYCEYGESPCIADSAMLKCRDSVTDGNGPEPNQPNTIDTCQDGTAVYSNPSCGGDESIENITITDLNNSNFRPGDTVEASAWVHCYAATDDHLGLVYTNNSDAATPQWQLLEFLEDGCSSAGYQEITFSNFQLDNVSGNHTLRVYITYDTSFVVPQNFCANRSGSRYDDNDDVVFRVGLAQANQTNNTAPAHSEPVLNSTFGTNLTTEDLACYNQSTYDTEGDNVKNIYNWFKNGSSVAVLNMPFEGGSNATYAKDYSGNGHDGEVISAAWNETTGYDSFGAYEFTDNNEYINTSWYPQQGNYTVAFWVNWNSLSSYQASGTHDENDHRLYIGTNGNYVYFGAGDTWSEACSHGMSTGTWYFLTLTTDGANAKYYVNGQETCSLNYSWSGQSSRAFTIGNMNGYGFDNSDRTMDAVVDDLIIFNSTLSSEQIDALYQNRTNLIVSNETSLHDTWRCEVTPSDQMSIGTTLSSSNLTIVNVTDTNATSKLSMEWGNVIADGSWTDVNLVNNYDNPVVVAGLQYANNSIPVVPRISNVTSDGFSVMIQNPSSSSAAEETLHYLVAEEGNWTLPDGTAFEARKYFSTSVDSKGSWSGESMQYNNTYTNPVVMVSVMSYNDSGWQAVAAWGSSRNDPPSSGSLEISRHAGEDPDTTRNNEIVSFIVIEQGEGNISDVLFKTGVGSDDVRGIDNNPPFSYDFVTPFSSIPEVGITTLAGLDGGDGGWSMMYGTNPLSTTQTDLVVDEDQLGDSERRHTTEQVAALVFETNGSYTEKAQQEIQPNTTFTKHAPATNPVDEDIEFRINVTLDSIGVPTSPELSRDFNPVTDADEYCTSPQALNTPAHEIWMVMQCWTGTGTPASTYGGDDWEIFVINSSDDGETWGSLKQLTNNSLSDIQPNIIIDDFEDFILVYEEDAASGSELFMMRSADYGLSWNTPYQLTNNTYIEGDPSIEQDSDGMYYITFESIVPPDADAEIYIMNSTDLYNWSVPVQLTNNSYHDYDPDILIDDSDKFWMAWSPLESTAQEVQLSYANDPFNPSEWRSNEIQLTNNSNHDYEPSLFIDRYGFIYVTYNAWLNTTTDDSRTEVEIIVANTTASTLENWTYQQMTNNTRRDTYPGMVHGAKAFHHLFFASINMTTGNLQVVESHKVYESNDIFNLTVTDVIPEGTYPVNGSITGNYQIDGNNITWNYDKLVAPSELILKFSTHADANISIGDYVNNTAYLSYMSYAGTWYNKTSSTQTQITAGANLPPSRVVLYAPANETSNPELAPTFVWYNATDPDSDALTYQLQVDDYSDFSSLDYNVTGIAEGWNLTNHTLLANLSPDMQYYWRVRAFDGTGFGNWSEAWEYYAEGTVSIRLLVQNMSFGGMDPGQENDTTDNRPMPFIIENDGNVNVDIELNASSALWFAQPLNTTYFRFMADYRNESGSFNLSGSQDSWENIASYNKPAIKQLKDTDENDTAVVDIYMKVPNDEAAGIKTADINFIATGS